MNTAPLIPAGTGAPPLPRGVITPPARSSAKPWQLGGQGESEDDTSAVSISESSRLLTTDESRSRARVISPRWSLAPLIVAVAGISVAAASLSQPRTALASLGVGAAASVLGAAVLMGGLRSQERQLRSLARVLQSDDAAASGRRQSAPALCREFEPLSREVFLHLNRLGDSLRRQHDKGVQLGARLAETNQRYMTVALDQYDGGLMVLDESRRVLMCNHAARRLLEFPDGDVLRRPLGELIGDAGLSRLFDETQSSVLHSRRSFDHVGADRTLRVTTLNMAISGDTPSAGSATATITLAYVHDATRERVQAKATSDFVSHVAHELRTPLSSLRAYVEMLVDGEATDEKTQRQYYEIIHSETDRMSRLIDDILNVARIESGVVKVTKQPLALAVITQDVVNVMQPQADKKSIRLISQLAPVMHQVQADKDMIHECLLNLVSNAVKYTPDGGTVTVRMRVSEQDHTITTDVIDTGIGIPAEDLPRMFEKFFRPKANAKMAKGTGLGLNLVRNIVETVHGGKVGLISAPGQGSTFSMTLPLM